MTLPSNRTEDDMAAQTVDAKEPARASHPSAQSGARSPISYGRKMERVLTVLIWLYVPITIALIAAWALDDTSLLGENVWIKPLKFAISIGLSGAAFVWILRRVPSNRTMRIATFASAAALLMEQILITTQAARGVRSHFNMTAGIDSTIYGAMGNIVGIVWVATLVLAINLSRRTINDPLLKIVTTAGTWLVLLGASVGFIMVAASKHSIGAEDGGPILPLVGWNRNAGDLRPAHFVGLHGLQVLIVFAWAARQQRWSTLHTLRALTSLAVVVGATCIALTVQALTSRSVATPSTLLVALLAAGAGLTTWKTTSNYEIRKLRNKSL
jgi:hypothetical protein